MRNKYIAYIIKAFIYICVGMVIIATQHVLNDYRNNLGDMITFFLVFVWLDRLFNKYF